MDVDEVYLHVDPIMLATLREQVAFLASLVHKLVNDAPITGHSTASILSATPPPQPADLKRLLQLRAQRRSQPSGSFLEWPAWDMLLDMAAVGAEGGHVSVSAICISSGAPQSTALRKLAQLERSGLVNRYLDDNDRRRVCLSLTDKACDMVNTRIAEDLRFYNELSEAFGRRRAAPASPAPGRMTSITTDAVSPPAH